MNANMVSYTPHPVVSGIFARHGLLLCLIIGLIGLGGIAPQSIGAEGVREQQSNRAVTVRIATFNASLNRRSAIELVNDLASGTDQQAKTIAEIIQRVQPDILLLNEFDYDPSGQAAAIFQNDYLAVSQQGARPIEYSYRFSAPSNTGVQSGFDLDNDGMTGGPGDAFGFGFFPGQFGMVIYSKYPIEFDQVRTFANFLWNDMPEALLPDDPTTAASNDWYDRDELAILRLSSKSHWDVPIRIGDTSVHMLVSHPTPPVFDGEEDRNGRRNHDEIRFWRDYVTPGMGGYIYDDNGRSGGLPRDTLFVIAGDLNADPLDGDSTGDPIALLLDNPIINASILPASDGGVEQARLQGEANAQHRSEPRHDTADFSDNAPGNLRADYVLPSVGLEINSAGIFWPTTDDTDFRLIAAADGTSTSSDHRLVWVDAQLYDAPQVGFVTNTETMLTARAPGVTITPLLTVGDRLPGGYSFGAIPDGIAVNPFPHNNGQLFDIYVNHETTTIPFFNQSDFENARVSKLTIDAHNRNIVDGRYVIVGAQNYVRFCSNFLAGPNEGLDRQLLFLNEESSNRLNPTGRQVYPANEQAIQAGRVVVYDPKRDDSRVLLGLGRHNHENTIAIPGYDEVILLSGDDTFSAPSSQLYLYRAPNTDAVWNDQGSLWVFKGDGQFNDYGDLTTDDRTSGTFVPVPNDIARGDQTTLENWSQENGAFQFIRLEDLAYDRNQSNVVYLADTGEPRAVPDPETNRLMRAPRGTLGNYPNGRVFRITLDPVDPTKVLELSILIDGDSLGAAGAGNVSLIHNPDNLETTPTSLLIQEDPGRQNSYPVDDVNGTSARIWQYDFASAELRVVAEVRQSDPNVTLGNWESSGIVDASHIFGPGSFLVTVQAHSLHLKTSLIPDPGDPSKMLKRKMEGGQLLLMHIQ